MRFTESWRSVKTDGWAISKAGVGDDKNKLNAALSLIDYAYSPEGQILMSYGPKEFIKTKADGSYETFNFNGEQWPVIADATQAELWDKAGGNYTNYARMYLGSTLSFVKSQAFEYQCTHEVGKEGAGYISNAIALGTIKHPELALASNPWYTSVPTVLPNSKVENDQIATFAELSTKGKAAEVTDSKVSFQLQMLHDLCLVKAAEELGGDNPTVAARAHQHPLGQAFSQVADTAACVFGNGLSPAFHREIHIRASVAVRNWENI